jgi:coproporphyrinogen III oxidase
MNRKEKIVHFLKNLRDEIVKDFQSLDPYAKFVCTPWNHHLGGGGEITVTRGAVLEKAAVNWSGVSGPNFPMEDSKGPFFATGVSIITHMNNPHMPTVHFNARYIEIEEDHWFGGGYDLTPMGISYEEDTKHFHNIAKQTLDSIDQTLYHKFYEAAKKYFFITHRNKERGVGGIFFDHYNTGHFEKDLDFWEKVAKSFLPAIMPIYRKRLATPFSKKDKEQQLILRGHYAEFNLIYDRGTQFGWRSKGNPEAILCSMPPCAKW